MSTFGLHILEGRMRPCLKTNKRWMILKKQHPRSTSASCTPSLPLLTIHKNKQPSSIVFFFNYESKHQQIWPIQSFFKILFEPESKQAASQSVTEDGLECLALLPPSSSKSWDYWLLFVLYSAGLASHSVISPSECWNYWSEPSISEKNSVFTRGGGRTIQAGKLSRTGLGINEAQWGRA